MTLHRKPFRMHHARLAALVLVTAAAIPPSAGAATTPVKVGDNYFVRASGVPKITVEEGDRVRFVFAGRSPHSVTVEDGPVRFRLPARTSGSLSKRMTTSGDYLLVCSIHGKRDMSMRLHVDD